MKRVTALQITGLAVALLFFGLATRTAADPDLWGHLRFGLDMLQTLALSSIDPYSFTQDRPWINHEWLSEAVAALAFRAGGIAGLTLLKAALVVGAIGIVWHALRGVEPVFRMSVVGVVVLGTGSVIMTIRPQLWSLLGIAVLARTLASDSFGRRWLPLLFAVWANLHGGWIVGFGLVAVWALLDGLVCRERALNWSAIVLACAVGTLATPYGMNLWKFLWNTVHLTRDIGEWQPLHRQPLMNWLPIAALCATAAWLATRPFPRRAPVLAALVVLACGAWRVSRIGPLFAVAAPILLAPALANRRPYVPWSLASPLDVRGTALMLAISAGLLGGGVWAAVSSGHCINVVGAWVPPSSPVVLLAGAKDGRLVTFFDWGEYAIWHLGPRVRVSMDGRRETVYSDARLTQHDAILAGTDAGFRALENWNAEYVWLPARSMATKTWLVSHGYRLELDTPISFVAVRSDLPALYRQSAATSDVRRCFPD
jgi:hypothetical protein